MRSSVKTSGIWRPTITEPAPANSSSRESVRIVAGSPIPHLARSGSDVRLATRHIDDPSGLVWRPQRNRELAAILERAASNDRVIDTTVLTQMATAMAIAVAADW